MAFDLDSPPQGIRTRRGLAALCALLAFGALSLPAGRASGQTPKFYFSLHGVTAATKISPAIKQKALKLFNSELKKHPEVITDLGTPPPQGPELQKVLKKRKLKGFGLMLRITKIQHQIHPPAPGKVYRLLMVEVAVAIDAEKLPSSELALAGEGSAQVGTEISKFKQKERDQLMLEALAEATKQAVKKTIAKLSKKKTTKKSRSRHKKKRKR